MGRCFQNVTGSTSKGLGRTGAWFAFEHEKVQPDGLILGKALGGGVLPVSAFLARRGVMDVFGPGSHGSTFGGNALAFRALQSRGLIDAIYALPDGLVLEGAGDCVWVPARNLFWMGYGPRTDAAAADVVTGALLLLRMEQNRKGRHAGKLTEGGADG